MQSSRKPESELGKSLTVPAPRIYPPWFSAWISGKARIARGPQSDYLSWMLFDRRSAERLRVLVVEPRDLVAARLKTQLETLGHWVLGFARDGEEAVTAAERLQPSLI